ncbi:DNA-binding transcriptional ArsR family regulator [Microbacterium sp. 1154]|uniref:ArsR/SmtB family transcription factor n=1 Tax=Microbacterium sp. 1154 TaxID=2817733 RepID=UPI002855CF48|nr:winged helix-turn-helix domain-containing protein [Microbacterium sp. 1154]MDR6692541.1 DNA-binding transcriptional ArsR family regulator [Microbacterium sp. 1154]
MTRYAVPQLPAGLERAISGLGGNAARIAVLSALVDHPRSTPGEVAEAVGLSVNTVRKHLGQLLEAGFLESDPPATLPFSERSGQRARYSVVADELNKAYTELGRALRIVEPEQQ